MIKRLLKHVVPYQAKKDPIAYGKPSMYPDEETHAAEEISAIQEAMLTSSNNLHQIRSYVIYLEREVIDLREEVAELKKHRP